MPPPVHCGTTILNKFKRASTEEFKRKVFTLLDKTKEMEHPYIHLDPKLVMKDPAYQTCGPLAILSYLQAEHGKLVADKEWEPLSTMPESNNASTDTAKTKTGTRTDDTASGKSRHADLTCRACGKKGHIKQNFTASGSSSSGDSEKTQPTRLANWKYINPKDITKA